MIEDSEMIAFRVKLNGKRLVLAGLPGHSVLSAIVTSVVRDPGNKASWAGKRAFVERELHLWVGGLDSDAAQHVDWVRRRLKVGDRIELEVMETNRVDVPKSRRPKPPAPRSKATKKKVSPQRKKARALR
ncbi:MAG: hypothetical protein QM756_20020 [Polyangiaceae bacterium]